MSKLDKKDLHTPFNNKTLLKLKGHIQKLWFNQFTAATQSLTQLSGVNPWNEDASKLNSLTFFSSTDAASGESMVIDVHRKLASSGVTASILSATFTFDSTKAKGVQHELPLAAATIINPGDQLLVSYVYTAGGTPSMTASRVQCEVA